MWASHLLPLARQSGIFTFSPAALGIQLIGLQLTLNAQRLAVGTRIWRCLNHFQVNAPLPAEFSYHAYGASCGRLVVLSFLK